MFQKLVAEAKRLISNVQPHQKEDDASEHTYLGMFGMTVDVARSNGLTLIPTNIVSIEEDLLDLIDWCRDRGCKVFWDRVIWDRWMKRWESNGIGGMDVLFVGVRSNDEETIIEAKLVWGASVDG